jgi:hypothetical protein
MLLRQQWQVEDALKTAGMPILQAMSTSEI